MNKLVFVVALLFFASPAFANDLAERQELARQYIIEVFTNDPAEHMYKVLQMQRGDKYTTDEDAAKVRQWMQEVRWDSIADQYTELLVSEFSVSELRQILIYTRMIPEKTRLKLDGTTSKFMRVFQGEMIKAAKRLGLDKQQ